jgi:hypothetical protein
MTLDAVSHRAVRRTAACRSRKEGERRSAQPVFRRDGQVDREIKETCNGMRCRETD